MEHLSFSVGANSIVQVVIFFKVIASDDLKLQMPLWRITVLWEASSLSCSGEQILHCESLFAKELTCKNFLAS